MRSYLSLIPISARVHRRQNRMTLLCIAISVFLVTAVFGMAETGFRMEADRLSAKHDDFNLSALLDSTMGQTMIPIALALFILILIAGVLMISGSINSTVAGRTKEFGILRCIGMSKRQIKHFVRLEAFNWCKTAIPVGLAAGIVFTWIICALLRFVVGEEFSEIDVFIISIPGIIGGTAVGLITVLIAASAPAKNAAKVSPVSAISGNSQIQKAKSGKAKRSLFRIESGLGIHHAMEMKKNLFLMAGSFALSIILFLSFLVLVDLVNCLMPQQHNDADLEITSLQGELLDAELVDILSEMEGVKRAFGRRAALDITASVNGEAENIDIISYDDFDLDCLHKDHLLKSGSNLNEVYGDSRYALATWDRECTLHIGDSIEIGDEQLKIAGLLKYDPFTSDGTTGGRITLITSGKTYYRLTGESGYQLINVQTTDDATDEDVDAIKALVGENGNVADCRDMSTFGTYMAFMMFVYGFLAIIALVALLNIINSISMSVSTRTKQYGVMRAIGMSTRQVTKMITAEAMTYAMTGCISGCVIGLVINRAMYRFLIENHFAYAMWSIPVIPLVVILLFVFGSVVLAVLSPTRRIGSMAINETITEL